jgi:glucose/arabinose dehydrogenase
MIEINLLPWRDYARAQRLKRFSLLLGGMILFALLVGCVCYFIFAAKAPAQTQRPAPKVIYQKPRKREAFEKMQFVGYLKQADRVWGLIKLPSGQVQEVTEGDSLERFSATVKTIREDKVIFVLPDKSERIVLGI